jgi:transcriptional repressor NrdR
MEALKALDDVAYVRFASVYKNFREAKDFEALLGELAGSDGDGAGDPEDDDDPPSRSKSGKAAASAED